MEMQLHSDPAPAGKSIAPTLRLPNLRIMSKAHKKAFKKHLKQEAAKQEHRLSTLGAASDSDSLSSLASDLTSLVHDSAFKCLPITGAVRGRSLTVLRLQRRRRSLTRLLRLTSILRMRSIPFTSCPAWLHLYVHCQQQYQVVWNKDVLHQYDATPWLEETKQLISSLRRSIRKEQHRLTRTRATPFDANPAARIHRMIKSDALPSQIFSIIDSNGELT
ncbi:MAG: hypothetical protein P4M11_08090, partial [Candidatus Pacebacteria bacterium]|nr:hypothetical protein [Candidatus Paceibacterota bacterium]